MNENEEISFEDYQRIKREYDEATPWRNLAFGICTIGLYALSLLNLFLK